MNHDTDTTAADMAIVSGGGRAEMVTEFLNLAHPPALLIVSENDHPMAELNRDTLQHLPHAELHLVPEATHRFSERGGARNCGSRIPFTGLRNTFYPQSLSGNTPP